MNEASPPKHINKGLVIDDIDCMTILSQAEADNKIRLQKAFVDKRPLIINRPYNEKRQLISLYEPIETFYLYITQTAIDFGNYSTVTRYFQIPLVRACIDPDKKHTNPDGTQINGPHIHIYREGFLDKFAQPLPKGDFPDLGIVQFVRAFLRYCSIGDIQINDQNVLPDGNL